MARHGPAGHDKRCAAKSDYATGANLNGEIKCIKRKKTTNPSPNWFRLPRTFNEESKDRADKIREDAKQSKHRWLGLLKRWWGKSSLVDELYAAFDGLPRKSGDRIGWPEQTQNRRALLGDRIRMNSIKTTGCICVHWPPARATGPEQICEGCVWYFESLNLIWWFWNSRHWASDTEIIEPTATWACTWWRARVLAPPTTRKIDMLEFADIAINKFDKRGALMPYAMWKNNTNGITICGRPKTKTFWYGTIASQFNDPGTNTLYKALMDKLVEKPAAIWNGFKITDEMSWENLHYSAQPHTLPSEISETRATTTTGRSTKPDRWKIYSIQTLFRRWKSRKLPIKTAW